MTEIESMIIFLKKYTAVPNKFIDTYYTYHKLCEKNLFGIDIKHLMDYLHIVDEKELRQRIRRMFKLDKDYIIKQEVKIGPKNYFKDIYYLTFDTFEKLCLLSRTKVGDSVRNYVGTLRKFVTYYHEHFANKINELTNISDYIYILLVDKKKNVFKVGVTQNVKKRLRTYATGMATHPDIKFIMAIQNKKGVEKCVKIFGKNAQYRVGKELYKIDYDTLKSLVSSCSELGKKFSKKECDNCNAYLVFDETKSDLYLDPYSKMSGDKKVSKKVSKKGSRKGSKKVSKKGSKKVSKKGSKKVSKKGSKKVSNIPSKKILTIA